MELVTYPNEILTTPTTPVLVFDDKVHNILDNMHSIMVQHKGMGLSANQTGHSLSMFIMQDKKGKVWEFINPKIVEESAQKVMLTEGCLSLKDNYVKIPRAQWVIVEAQDRNGEFFKVMAEEIESVCLLHENDHLLGVFFLDRLNRQQRRAILRKVK